MNKIYEDQRLHEIFKHYGWQLQTIGVFTRSESAKSDRKCISEIIAIYMIQVRVI